MSETWVQQQWLQLCERLKCSAEHCGSEKSKQQADEFCGQAPPERYADVLARVRDAAVLAISWQQTNHQEPQNQDGHDSELIQEAGEESFPASDPPSWNSSAI
ncbi:hypothetical protein Q31b_34270 [Novipirellula aureliae]|uniref:Uncharacterized protein n=1 Tax=Novipirellula aureliae TaxID=2527966 RepID=A0A5C6DRZ8_9BACT|nr:hypothetical protein [Novipirellula aureliae]TWU40083.1 hypothetical protein Q31b_34270 [Novipirellula aureliae]